MRKKAVVFRTGPIFFGFDIMRVVEVISYTAPLHVAGNPDFVEGVLTLRDREIVSVIDFRKRLEEDDRAITPDTRIIIFTIDTQMIGLIVDDASDLLLYTDDEVLERPDYVSTIRNEYIIGFVKHKEKTITLLDLDRILSTSESVRIAEFHNDVRNQEIKTG